MDEDTGAIGQTGLQAAFLPQNTQTGGFAFPSPQTGAGLTATTATAPMTTPSVAGLGVNVPAGGGAQPAPVVPSIGSLVAAGQTASPAVAPATTSFQNART
jgi:hypothetical protein